MCFLQLNLAFYCVCPEAKEVNHATSRTVKTARKATPKGAPKKKAIPSSRKKEPSAAKNAASSPKASASPKAPKKVPVKRKISAKKKAPPKAPAKKTAVAKKQKVAKPRKAAPKKKNPEESKKAPKNEKTAKKADAVSVPRRPTLDPRARSQYPDFDFALEGSYAVKLKSNDPWCSAGFGRQTFRPRLIARAQVGSRKDELFFLEGHGSIETETGKVHCNSYGFTNQCVYPLMKEKRTILEFWEADFLRLTGNTWVSYLKGSFVAKKGKKWYTVVV